jgi:hypothetical protein
MFTSDEGNISTLNLKIWKVLNLLTPKQTTLEASSSSFKPILSSKNS